MDEKLEGQACNLKAVPPFPEKTALAMAYVPFQKFENLYPPEKALDSGTLFSDLDKPFEGGAKS